MISVLIAAAALASVLSIGSLISRPALLQRAEGTKIAAGFAVMWIGYFLLSASGIGLLRLIWQAIAR